MEIYLAIIETYLAIAFTIFLVTLEIHKNRNLEIKLDNEKRKTEVRDYFNKLTK